MNTKLANWMLVLVFLVMEVNCDDSLQFLDQKKLFETTTVDERGDVRARVVAQTVPSTNRNVRQVDSKHGAGYSSDDEDSNLDEGSGESAKMNDNVANDEPVPASVATATVSLLNSITPSSTINVLVTVTSKTNDSSVAPSAPMSTQASNISVTPRPSTVVGLTSSPSTNLKDTTITITQAVPTSSITASSTTVAPLPEVKTDSTTTADPSTIVSIQATDVAENKSDVTKAAPTGILETTTETDHENENVTIPTEVTNIKSTKATLKPTSRHSVFVKAHQDPTEKPRETLFGFVTVEILIALSAGALFSVLLVAFLVYRLKKRNEGSYELSETIALRPKELEEMGTKKEVFV